jgi:hypothetical protein
MPPPTGTLTQGEDGGGTGIGPGGSTTTTTTTTTGAVSTAQQFGGGGGGTGQYPVVVDNDGASGFGTKCGPGIDVPRGCVVEVYPYEKNTANAYVAKGPDEARTGPRSAHSTGAPVMTWTVGNLSELWVYAKAGEGVLLRIQRRV